MCLMRMWFRWTKDLKIDIYEGEEALELKVHGWVFCTIGSIVFLKLFRN